MALLASSLHFPTNTSPKDKAAIAETSTFKSEFTIKGTSNSRISAFPEPAYAMPNPYAAPYLTDYSALSNYSLNKASAG